LALENFKECLVAVPENFKKLVDASNFHAATLAL